MSEETKHSGHLQDFKVYALILGALFALTAVTVAISFKDFGIFNNLVAVLIALLKSSLVVLFFMHGRYEGRIIWAFIYFPFFLLLLLLGSLYLDYGTRDEKDFAVKPATLADAHHGDGAGAADAAHAATDATPEQPEETVADAETATANQPVEPDPAGADVADATTATAVDWGELPGDAARGKEKAKIICIACHVIDGVGNALPGAPPFEQSANEARITPDYLRKWLKDPLAMKPGTLMPNFSLSDEDIEDYIAFLHSLKKQ